MTTQSTVGVAVPTSSIKVPEATAVREPRPPPKWASSPFDRVDADFILRSNDNVAFQVHRVILSMASTFFEGMFPLPQPPKADGTAIPSVDLGEDSRTIDTFLPGVETLQDVRKVLEAGTKYEAEIVTHAMKKALVSPRFLDTAPVLVYAIACISGLEEEARVAAKKAVINDVVLKSQPHELDEISAGEYHRLLRLDSTWLRVKLTRRTKTVITVEFTGIVPFCRPMTSTSPSPRLESQPMFTVTDGDVILRANDSTDFRVHRSVIALASPALLDGLERLQEREADETPVFLIPEDSATVEVLLRLCYPVEVPQLADASTLLHVAFAARKHRLVRVEQLIRTSSSWMTEAAKAPLRFYFAATSLGWRREAQECARELTQGHTREELIKLYIPEMETNSSRAYRHLLAYDKACRDVVAAEHTLSLSGLSQLCFSAACQKRYPSTLLTSDLPQWMQVCFNAIKESVVAHPSGKTLCLDSPSVQAFLGVVAADESSCDGRVGTPFSFSSPCTKDIYIEWAMRVTRSFAPAVDMAVSKVNTFDYVDSYDGDGTDQCTGFDFPGRAEG
ncbi:hypothetical protein C8Q74DRAFT_1215634 [Fomes fomentarius]|nr:hypothetical protein C8Q74DRAFT_1215634 [Fomes fomentarius]